MDLGSGYGHLAYSMLVHPGDTWPEMRASMEQYLPEVKRRASPDAPLGVSLRISNSSATTLTNDREELLRTKRFLDEHGLYVFTVNAFPYGPFKGERVKERVYEPDWGTEERLRYTMQVADILSVLAAPGVEPSIQTAPLAFRPNVHDENDIRRFTDNVIRLVAHLMRVETATGVRVKLAIEPEPFCYLETIPETVTYFKERLYSLDAARRLSELTGLPLAEMFHSLRRHLGVVLDICHQSVEFEDIAQDIAQLSEAGIPIYKLQAAAALQIPDVNAVKVEALRKFTGTIYLSQTTQRKNGELQRFLNLEDAIDQWDPSDGPCEWRTHFHVPVFLDDLGEFHTTRAGIDAALAVHARTPLSTHVEIETYTWDVLPQHLKDADITEYVVRELQYVRNTLAAMRETD